MRNFGLIIISVLMVVAMGSCESFSEHHQPEGKDMESLAERVESMDSDLCKFMDKVNDLEKEVKNPEKKNDRNLLIVGLALSAFSIVVCGFVCYICYGISKKIKKLEGDLSNYKDQLRGLASRKTNEASSKSYTPDPYRQVYPQDGAIKELERRVQYLEQSLSRDKHQEEANEKRNGSKPVSVHTEYAMHTKTDIFGDVAPSRQEGSLYVITSTQEGKGEFDIISLAKLKNQDGWDKVVDCSGDCRLADATRYEVESPGLCEKVDGGWKVTGKLKIKIFKK